MTDDRTILEMLARLGGLNVSDCALRVNAPQAEVRAAMVRLRNAGMIVRDCGSVSGWTYRLSPEGAVRLSELRGVHVRGDGVTVCPPALPTEPEPPQDRRGLPSDLRARLDHLDREAARVRAVLDDVSRIFRAHRDEAGGVRGGSQ